MAAFVERRTGERFPTLADAKILNDGKHLADVKITDYSARGARIQTIGKVFLPARFTLQLDDGRAAMVDYLWRIDDQVGVVFLEPMKEARAVEKFSNFA